MERAHGRISHINHRVRASLLGIIPASFHSSRYSHLLPHGQQTPRFFWSATVNPGTNARVASDVCLEALGAMNARSSGIARTPIPAFWTSGLPWKSTGRTVGLVQLNMNVETNTDAYRLFPVNPNASKWGEQADDHLTIGRLTGYYMWWPDGFTKYQPFREGWHYEEGDPTLNPRLDCHAVKTLFNLADTDLH